MRKRKRKTNESGGSPAWMNTYGDLVTLLLCFFILLFSFSSIDAQKFKIIMSSLKGSLGVLTGGEMIIATDIELNSETKGLKEERESMEDVNKELRAIADDLSTYLEEQSLEQYQVTIDYTEGYVKLNFLDGIFFDPGKAIIKKEAIPVLDAVGIKLAEYENNMVKIEGHTDTVPMRSAQYPNNWYLSAARAITVAEFYINEKGFDPQRLSAEGFGEYAPIATNDTAEGKTKNRRIEIKILSSIYNQKNKVFID